MINASVAVGLTGAVQEDTAKRLREMHKTHCTAMGKDIPFGIWFGQKLDATFNK